MKSLLKLVDECGDTLEINASHDNQIAITFKVSDPGFSSYSECSLFFNYSDIILLHLCLDQWLAKQESKK